MTGILFSFRKSFTVQAVSSAPVRTIFFTPYFFANEMAAMIPFGSGALIKSVFVP